jgi:16S rRNA (guanine1207-N2)-methyltransferase
MRTVETKLEVPQGRFRLVRPDGSPRSPLRAWDAADEYILHHVPDGDQKTLIVNDSFGALAVALADRDIRSISDSLLAMRAAESNLASNSRTADLVTSVEPVGGPFDLVVIKVPRTLGLLEEQLHTIRTTCHPQTVVVGAGMARHIHTSTLELFDRIIGSTTTSLAKKKARLIHARFDPDLDPGPNPWPKRVLFDNSYDVVVHGGVFGGIKLDIGTRTLLTNLPSPGTDLDRPLDVVDLGCGNGIVGTTIAGTMAVQLTLVDESYLAVASAVETFSTNHPERTAAPLVDDCGESIPDASIDLVLNNPPFHLSDHLADTTAWKMFTQARRILRPAGELRIVGNRHLGYHTKLKRLFGNCEVVTSTPKFVVLSARR